MLRTALIFVTTMLAGIGHASASDLAALCDEADTLAESERAAISNVQYHRGPIDFEGARLAGCLHNRGDEPLRNLMVAYRGIQERGGGGGTTNLEFAEIAPGESAVFLSGPFRNDAEHFENWKVSGYQIVALESFPDDEYPLDPVIELGLPLVDRPAHDLEAECAGIDAGEGEGDVWVSHAEFADAGPPGAAVRHVVGCVTNRSDETIADDRRNRVRVRHSGRAGAEPNRMGMVGGSGGLVLQEPLEPGQSAFFVSSFDYDDPLLEVAIEPGGMAEVDGAFEFVAAGPEVELERGLED